MNLYNRVNPISRSVFPSRYMFCNRLLCEIIFCLHRETGVPTPSSMAAASSVQRRSVRDFLPEDFADNANLALEDVLRELSPLASMDEATAAAVAEQQRAAPAATSSQEDVETPQDMLAVPVVGSSTWQQQSLGMAMPSSAGSVPEGLLNRPRRPVRPSWTNGSKAAAQHRREMLTFDSHEDAKVNGAAAATGNGGAPETVQGLSLAEEADPSVVAVLERTNA